MELPGASDPGSGCREVGGEVRILAVYAQLAYTGSVAETKSRRMSAYLEPFGMRALGIVREDEKLLAEAAARFEGIELDWHAAETRRLVPGET